MKNLLFVFYQSENFLSFSNKVADICALMSSMFKNIICQYSTLLGNQTHTRRFLMLKSYRIYSFLLWSYKELNEWREARSNDPEILQMLLINLSGYVNLSFFFRFLKKIDLKTLGLSFALADIFSDVRLHLNVYRFLKKSLILKHLFKIIS